MLSVQLSQNKTENSKELFYIENLYETCNEDTNYIETQILAKDNEDKMKKDLENIINKIHNKDSLKANDKRFLRTISVQMSIRNPYGVKAVEEKYNNVSDRELFFKYSFANDEYSLEKRKIINVNLKMYSFDHLRMYNIDHINTCCSRR